MNDFEAACRELRKRMGKRRLRAEKSGIILPKDPEPTKFDKPTRVYTAFEMEMMDICKKVCIGKDRRSTQ